MHTSGRVQTEQDTCNTILYTSWNTLERNELKRLEETTLKLYGPRTLIGAARTLIGARLKPDYT
jgi:hypothetical protein